MEVSGVVKLRGDECGEVVSVATTWEQQQRQASDEALVCSEQRVLLLDTRTREQRTMITAAAGAGGAGFTAACYQGDDKNNMLVAREDGHVCVYDRRRPDRPAHDIDCSGGEEVNGLWPHPSKHFVAATDDDGSVSILDARQGKVFKRLAPSQRAHTLITTTAAFLPNQRWEVLTAGMDCMLLRWLFSKGRVLERRHFKTDTEEDGRMFNPPLVHHMAINGPGNRLAIALGSGDVHVLDINQQAETRQRLQPSLVLTGKHTYDASRVAFLQDHDDNNARLVSCGNDRRVCVWDISRPGLPRPASSGGNGPATSSTKMAADARTQDEGAPDAGTDVDSSDSGSRLVHSTRCKYKINDLRAISATSIVFADTQGNICLGALKA
ncbi:hypothetical protein PTSG_01427 [Salpingoeca rosetta]|uniref:Uncharacterized protein n=1 Tax=Salpingoeca rosetta (strain ATCC 50818 / BSB-021) TaxID=946362 RepID=F2U0B3_SALR5|nr:uncharacterized protein PTSG_01427 [Salpingoeca rosetta]EGD80841.1 hypothetical protein PTSG_01427 [Salpingoeca rosetta]|eukprot:XP_004997402.1 hypothetical protein PTSG_01427 [Salpingoeca rosetta]